MIDEFLIKTRIYKINEQLNMSGEFRIRMKDNPNFEDLIAILGTPSEIKRCHCKQKIYGWKLGKTTLIIED